MGDEDRVIAERYRLVARLGRGGMGVVWQAYDERLHRKVAVKQLIMPAELTGPQTAEAMRLAVHEGRIAARLQHRNAIALYDVVEDDGHAYLIMEYLQSRSLSEVLTERGPLTPAETMEIGAQVADALTAAHLAGVVHRDVKPGNVLLGDDGTVKITDFGISRAVEDVGATVSGMVLGTPAYLSPEVAQGERATFASDVFSLGAMLFTAVEGTPPVGAVENTMAVLHRIASGNVNAPAKAGPMTGVLEQMLHTDPQERPSMAEVRDSLFALAAPPQEPAEPVEHLTVPIAQEPPSKEPQTQEPQPQESQPREPLPEPRAEPLPAAQPKSRRKAGLIVAGLVGLAASAGALVLLLDQDEGGNPSAAPQPSSSSSAPLSSSEPVSAPPIAPTPATTPTTTEATPKSLSGQPVSAPLPGPQPLSAAITDYYALMPGNLNEAWTRLTPKYQQSPAGGRKGYENYWSRIQRVQVSGVSVTSATTVEATVEYHFKDNRIVQERHRYFCVSQDGQWRIDQSAVLSSRTVTL